jgi:YbgC/YbaW family acyl-CoA thioester hydrolase
VADIRTATEALIGSLPVTIRRRVKWGECDPAGVVYFVNYGEYVVSAYEMMMAELLGLEFQKAKAGHGVALPARAFKIDFSASLRPDDEFLMTVEISDIRTRTFDALVRGRAANRSDLFQATLTLIAVQPVERSAMTLPAALVAELQRYRAACASAAAT